MKLKHNDSLVLTEPDDRREIVCNQDRTSLWTVSQDGMRKCSTAFDFFHDLNSGPWTCVGRRRHARNAGLLPASSHLSSAASRYLDLLQRRSLEDQIELRWFRKPRQSLVCYCASVALIIGLGLGGVGFLSITRTGKSSEWRLVVGTTLCLLSLAVLLKQLLSSAIQDMNCVHSRRRIDQLKSGGRADPALILVVGLAVMLCGTVLLCVDHDSDDMLVSGLVLMAVGLGMTLAVVGYGVLVYLKRRREHTRRRRAIGARRLGRGSASVFRVSGGPMNRAGRETSLI